MAEISIRRRNLESSLALSLLTIIEYSHWQEPYLENMAEQNFPAKCLFGFKKLHVVFLSAISNVRNLLFLCYRGVEA